MKATRLITIFFCVLLAPAMAGAQMQSYPKESEELEFATELLGQAEYQSAASSYEEFIREYPRSSLLPNAYLGAGDSHFFLKEPEKAMEFYQLYENRFPHGKDKWLVSLREAQCLYLKGKTDAVIAKLEGIDPASIPPRFQQTYYFYLASVLMDKGDLKDAAANFEKVVEVKSTGDYATLAYLRLSAILARTGNNKEALDVYNGALQSNDSLEIQAKIKMMQGLAYLQAQQYDMAAMSFKTIVDDFPTVSVAKDAAANWFIALLKGDQADELIAEYNEQFKNRLDDPSWGRVHLLAVDALLAQKQYDEAFGILNALITDPAMGQEIRDEALLQKAKVLADAGQFDQALQLISTQNFTDKDTQAAMDLLKGQIYLGLHEDNKAARAFSDAGQANPDNGTIYCGQAHILHARGHDPQSASLFMECFNKARNEPTRQDALYSAFLMYKDANRTGDAVKTSQLYMADYPQGTHFYDIIFNLADMYSQNKKYDRAIDILKALAGSTSYEYQVKGLFQVAYNLQLEGKPKDALALYKIIINQNTDPQMTSMALKNSALIYSQNNDDGMTAKAMYALIVNFHANDFSPEDDQWLIRYFRQKNDLQHMDQVIAATTAAKGG